MNKREAAVITMYTGVLIGSFSDAHKYAEDILGQPIFTHQFAEPEMIERIKDLSREEFLRINEEITD